VAAAVVAIVAVAAVAAAAVAGNPATLRFSKTPGPLHRGAGVSFEEVESLELMVDSKMAEFSIQDPHSPICSMTSK
jgi:hypothetical protein